MKPRDLPEKWRKKADGLRRYAPEVANALEDCVAELEAAFAEWELEELTLQDAASESGYSYSQLQRLVADGQIPNAGKSGAPRVRRVDVPRKPARGTRPGAADFADEILARRTG